jgi:hypothetical protein
MTTATNLTTTQMPWIASEYSAEEVIYIVVSVSHYSALPHNSIIIIIIIILHELIFFHLQILHHSISTNSSTAPTIQLA